MALPTNSSTSTLMTESASHSRMTSSTSSLTSNSPSQPNVARVYKHASQLFLTRRVREALEALEPLLQPGPPATDEHGDKISSSAPQSAPIALASRNARIKVWSLYISILNAIIEMGPEEGQTEFGSANWKELVKRAREGTIWQGVVNVGYNGREGAVDTDVVANLATLLLAHAPNQRQTQQRLETYLAASSQPDLDVEAHLQKDTAAQVGSNGTSTPRDLMSRLKLIEIYALHVLPRNDEWDYARQIINMSETLDEDRKESFLSTLQSLQDEKKLAGKKEAELQRQREQQMQNAQRREADARTKEEELQKKRDAQAVRDTRLQDPERHQPVMKGKADGLVQVNGKDVKSVPPRQSHLRKAATKDKPHGSSAAAKKQRSTPPGMLAMMQHAISSFGINLRRNPMIILRFLAFMVALLMALSRQDIRDRLARVREAVWDKVKSTVGMGVKVSYI